MEPYQQLETAFAEFHDLNPSNMVVCSSGTAALHLALETFEITPNFEVVVPDYTMMACARAVILAGLIPRFVDCNADDLLIDTDQLPLSGSVAAIMPVHVYGRRCDMDTVHDYAVTTNAWVIEDLAEAHGLMPDERTDAACWSFYKNKIIHGQEGGAIYFKDVEHAKRARLLRNLGFTPEQDYHHIPRGHNYRLADALAELVLRDLQHAGDHIALRGEVCDYYDRYLPAGWRIVAPRHANWVYDLRIPGLTFEQQRNIINGLRAKGIQARYGFYPLSKQAEFLRWVEQCVGSNAERAACEVIYLPIDPYLAHTTVRDWLYELMLQVHAAC